ncbi:MAG TPA: hypothetical protein VG326_14415 [Tepidisphaeraceae bacterium]|jgi:hypothetical protein|nr:hypothetical protein [Tepidisphaeraceae bacterium]
MHQLLLRFTRLIGAVGFAVGGLGCHTAVQTPADSSPQALSTLSTTEPTTPIVASVEAVKAVDALVDPPTGWVEDPRRIDAKHAHVVWKSPTGDTAYGVVLMHLPFPVGPDLVLAGFLNHLRETDHEAQLLTKQAAPDLPGYRFTAESGQYVLRVDLTVRGWRAWAVYAGSLREKPANMAELRQAERARDHTRVGLPAESAFAE